MLSIPAAAGAQSLSGAREWLPPGSLSLDALSLHPEEMQGGGVQQSFYAEYGRLAFRSPMVLGGTASKAGLSCQACHPNGFANEDFFIPGLSDAHGRIDVTQAFWNNRGENHRNDPLTIPSLRGVKSKDRLGHDRRSASLREFTRRVIVTEFGGNEPNPTLLDALVAYQETLQPATVVDRPVTMAGDLADIGRHLNTLAVPLAEENAALSGTIATMVRGQLGFIHERLDGDDLAAARDIVEGWSRGLEEIAGLAVEGKWRPARDRLAALHEAVAAPPAALANAGPRSLYNPVRLKAWLARSPAATQ
ncbi:hypothetical protein [Ferrovibrio xuzhouensis]|uniref:Cytochrome c domain-containing protein n=1 Tax=Ferrovibrio xuzhouensis TaxID=1576914 RepID=A0ABV7VHC6_9PROT